MKTQMKAVAGGMVALSILAVASLIWAATVTTREGEMKAEVSKHYREAQEARIAMENAQTAQQKAETAMAEAVAARDAALAEAVSSAEAERLAAEGVETAAKVVETARSRQAEAEKLLASMEARRKSFDAAMKKEETALKEWDADLQRREDKLRTDYFAVQDYESRVAAWADSIERGAASAQQRAFAANAFQDIQARRMAEEAAAARQEELDYARRIAEASEQRALELQLLNTQIRQMQTAAPLFE